MKAQSNDSMYEDKQFQSLLSLTRSEYSKEIFISYFTKIAEVLVNDDDNTLISFLSFSNYMKLPIFLCKRIFSGIDRNRNSISVENFAIFLSELYAGDVYTKIKIVFQIFDINKENSIQYENFSLSFYLWY